MSDLKIDTKKALKAKIRGLERLVNYSIEKDVVFNVLFFQTSDNIETFNQSQQLINYVLDLYNNGFDKKTALVAGHLRGGTANEIKTVKGNVPIEDMYLKHAVKKRFNDTYRNN